MVIRRQPGTHAARAMYASFLMLRHGVMSLGMIQGGADQYASSTRSKQACLERQVLLRTYLKRECVNIVTTVISCCRVPSTAVVAWSGFCRWLTRTPTMRPQWTRASGSLEVTWAHPHSVSTGKWSTVPHQPTTSTFSDARLVACVHSASE